MPQLMRDASPTLKLVIVGALLVGSLFTLAGIWLVYLGATGETEFIFFGQTFKSGNAGIAAIFLGAATIVILLRRTLVTLDQTVRTESSRPMPERLDDVLGVYERLRAGLGSPLQNVEQIALIANSTDPAKERYLTEFASRQEVAFIEVDAVRQAREDLDKSGRVAKLFERVSAAEKEKISGMLPATDDPLFGPVMFFLKYWRYVTRKTHPSFVEVNDLLAKALSRRRFGPEELALAQKIMAAENTRLDTDNAT